MLAVNRFYRDNKTFCSNFLFSFALKTVCVQFYTIDEPRNEPGWVSAGNPDCILAVSLIIFVVPSWCLLFRALVHFSYAETVRLMKLQPNYLCSRRVAWIDWNRLEYETRSNGYIATCWRVHFKLRTNG